MGLGGSVAVRKDFRWATALIWLAVFSGLLGVGSLLAGDPATPSAVAWEQQTAGVTGQAADVTQEIAGGEPSSGDELSDLGYTINTLFMFLCAVLVLFMQAGFALLEVGLSQAKHTVNILAKNVMDVAIGVLLYLLIGFAVMYPGGAWPVHGLCGLWGGLATGIFGSLPEGINSTNGFVAVQAIGAAALCCWAFATMFLVFWTCKRLGILRVSAAEEQVGLDIAEHGMHAYPND